MIIASRTQFHVYYALVGAFSVIVKTGCGTDGSICGTNCETRSTETTVHMVPGFLTCWTICGLLVSRRTIISRDDKTEVILGY